jgi:hypothetical protein
MGVLPQRGVVHGLSLWLAAAVGALVIQAFGLWAMGLPLICRCGTVALWHGNPSGPETSQHLTDWYTYTHVIHGFTFYLMLWLIAPRLSFVARLALAIGLESAWEVIENTPFVMDRYRQSALARGYFGDSIVNSFFDTIATAAGFLLARLLPVWQSIFLIVATELVLGYAIRDNLTLNILQLIYPSQSISNWQSGA